MRLLLPLLAALATAAPAAAQSGWENAGPQPEAGSQAARDGFGVMVLPTDDQVAFMRAWESPTPPTLPTTSVAERGRPVYAMIVFHGCAAGPDGNCNVTAEFTTLRPDGHPHGDRESGEIWRDRALAGGNLRLGRSAPILAIGPRDPAGVWTMQARVTDHVRGVTLQIEARLRVETPPAPAGA